MGKGGVHRLHVGAQVGEKAVILRHRLRIRLQIRTQPRHVAAEIGACHVLLLQPRRQLLRDLLHLLRRLDDHAPQRVVLLLRRRGVPVPGVPSRLPLGGGNPRAAAQLLQLSQRQIQLLAHLHQIEILLRHLLLHRPRRCHGHGKCTHSLSLPFSYTAAALYRRQPPLPVSFSRSCPHRWGRRYSTAPRVCSSVPVTLPTCSHVPPS